MTVDNTFVESIVELVDPYETKVGDKTYCSQKLHEVKPALVSEPKPLTLQSLNGLVDFINTEDFSVENKMLVHIQDHENVILYGLLNVDDENRRFSYAKATPIRSTPQLSTDWMTQEDLMIGLQAFAEETPVWKAVIGVVSKVTDNLVASFDDDGTSQEVTIAAGLNKALKKLPNPILLKPYRTFPEIDQPESRFILRMQANSQKGAPPFFKIISADGDKWKLEAVGGIKKFLQAAKLPANVQVIA